MKLTRLVSIITVSTIIGAILIFNWIKNEPPEARIIVPDKFSVAANPGRLAYADNCATCHGTVGQGSEKGPPLIHDIYNPGHHGDVSFYRAARFGVRAHHWRFGNMPPQPQVNETWP